MSATVLNYRSILCALIVFILLFMLMVFKFGGNCKSDYSLIDLNKVTLARGSKLKAMATLLREREENIYMIPSDDVLDASDQIEQLQIYWRYINTLQFLCRNQTRLGSLKDGGKEICVDDRFGIKRPCLVYSFGSRFMFDFELAINKYYGCEVHTFDPSADSKRKAMPYELHFHMIGLASKDYINNQNWKMQTLSTIMTNLHHEGKVIDILKIDIEGAEWDALPDIFSSGILERVRQISMEVHFVGDEKATRHQLKVLRQLYDQGFRLFMHEHNLDVNSLATFPQPVGTITTVNEVSLVNINY